MYSAFYSFHLFLGDFEKINYPKTVFFVAVAITYLFVSFLLYKIFHFKFYKKLVSNVFLRGIGAGVLLGVLLYAVSLVLRVSFTTKMSLKHMMFDCTWQIIEQSIGGVVIALGQLFIFEPKFEDERAEITD